MTATLRIDHATLDTRVLEVRRCTVADLVASPRLADLLREYGEEYPTKDFGEPRMQVAQYEHLERAGLLHPIAAYRGEELVGFVAVLVAVQPHFGNKIALTESLFVASSERTSGAGLKLLREAQRLAKEHQCLALMSSAPIGSRLEKLLPMLDYKPNTTAFYKIL